ncbi:MULTISPECIES: helix-turn-helix transcriptional regulator [Sphingobacterium]|uniref:Helix-turn-helix transcriptional regulator n=1 Tax=Sphingobacterium tenebrionis TaxID=3111775 RepID=A0ABU8I6R8_9SPHI|nr:helix-turn-helix transcriptional regulator [Sphingobacterium sp. 1.A.4]
MRFKELEDALEQLVLQIKSANLSNTSSVRTEEFMDLINSSPYLITIHDVEFYRPIGINDAMRLFYGFQKNWLTGMDYLYYLQTIHTSTYHSLLNSLTFFRKDKPSYLNLDYKLLHHSKEFRLVIGTSKTIIRTENGKPKYAITVAKESSEKGSTSKLDLINQLTSREKEIAQLLIDGVSKKEIAGRLFISTSTVQTHSKTIYKKLKINKISELISLGDTFSFQLMNNNQEESDLHKFDPFDFR